MANRLINEKSPYLLQHARNPVDWYPWCEEAFSRARSENKPILLSIGYSTCHWCHVMERESFNDPKIAETMNSHFVCIKLDREERPDLDHIYITAVSSLTGSAGWPLNVFLTPELKPFFGGTYFSPEPGPGRISWPDLLRMLAKAWADPAQHLKIMDSADELTQLIISIASSGSGSQKIDPDLPEAAFKAFEKSHDKVWGGFSRAPKFPSPSILSFLLSYHAHAGRSKRTEGQKALQMALLTLRGMARGGIFDQLGGGFHRYSTDSRWLVPHFEKMLYDNAQLICSYLEAFRITGDLFFKKTAEETILYILRDMSHPEGGFFSAEDADSLPSNADSASREAVIGKKEEGAFYVWPLSEVKDLLGDRDAGIVSYRYGLRPGGNVENDPYGEFRGKNILYREKSIEETARKFGMSVPAVTGILEQANMRLLEYRNKRPRPHLDDKIITEWNGMMISALAKAFQVLGDKKYLIAGSRCAEFIKTSLFDPEEKRLFRIWRDGDRKIEAPAGDYAFLIHGVLDLYESGPDPRWLDWALELSEILIRRFYDSANGGFFTNPHFPDPNLIARFKETHDGVIPSAGSVATIALYRLARHTDRRDLAHIAESTLKSFIPAMQSHPGSAPAMLLSLDFALGNPESAETRKS
ncbi:MAG: hypothetical protein A2V65_11830 [Deltaproteobacteria bacterium RBG_13_49_15]|nr:MAG: hypothetical protein A2V65_11830 [Deltaproteobacteria bacterium RBG_13_49_15]